MFFDCLYITGSIGALFIYDRMFAQYHKRRWYLVHAFGNGVVVVFSIHGVIASLGNPVHCMDSRVFPSSNAFIGPTSKLPMSMITALHIYHIFGFTVSAADRLHHMAFVPIIALCGHVMDWGALRQFLAFFICGLPGCIDYLQLCCLQSEEARKRRKYITMMLNLSLRAPFLCIEATLHFVALVHKTTTVHPVCNIMIAGLVLVNAMFYAYTSVRSYVLSDTPR